MLGSHCFGFQSGKNLQLLFHKIILVSWRQWLLLLFTNLLISCGLNLYAALLDMNLHFIFN